MKNVKTVLITGSAKGIGAAIARKMASCGYSIVINYLHSQEKAEELKKELEEKYSCSVLLVQADVSLESEVKEMIQKVMEKFGVIDCVVNNAAITKDGYFQEKSGLEFLSVLNTNLVGAFLVSKYAGIEMLKQKSGKIINISSTNGIDTYEDYSMDYDASKAGLISLTQNFAKALAPYVLVNGIAPGWTETASVLEMNPTYLEEERKKILLERFARPSEIANLVAFLASDENTYINGTIIRIDGGIQ